MKLPSEILGKLNVSREQVEQIETSEIITELNNRFKPFTIKPSVNYDKVNEAIIIKFIGGIGFHEILVVENILFDRGYIMTGVNTVELISECTFVKEVKK